MLLTCQRKVALRQHLAGLIQEAGPEPVQTRRCAQLLAMRRDSSCLHAHSPAARCSCLIVHPAASCDSPEDLRIACCATQGLPPIVAACRGAYKVCVCQRCKGSWACTPFAVAQARPYLSACSMCSRRAPT